MTSAQFYIGNRLKLVLNFGASKKYFLEDVASKLFKTILWRRKF